jgi:DNA repair protein RadD
MTLRDYQLDARYQINTLLNASRHPLYVAPTGTGKTKTAVAVIQDRIKLNRRIFILTPQEEIFSQWQKELSVQGINAGYIDSKGIQGRDRMVYVCMPMSLLNIIHLLPRSIYPDEIITDECHHSGAKTYEQIYLHFQESCRLGLTATPYRGDNRPLGKYYTDIISTTTMAESINNGHLCKPLIIVPELYSINIPLQNGDYDVQMQAEQLGTTKIIGDVIKHYGEIFAGLPVLVACSTYKHAELMTAEFVKAGWIFEHIHSKLSDGDRKRMIREIRSGKLNGLCTVGIGIEGMDLPGLYGLIWMRRTMSLTIYLQFIGRVLRPLAGKEYGIIIDGVGNCFIHGRPELDRQWSLESDYKPDEGEKAPRMRICPACGVMNAFENLKCHICGSDLAAENEKNKRKLPTMVDGRLVVLDSIDGAEWLANRIQQKKVENEILIETEKKIELQEVSKTDKMKILSKNLTGKKISSIFSETLKNYI